MAETVLMLNIPVAVAGLTGAILFVLGLKIGQYLQSRRDNGGGKFIENIISGRPKR